MELYVAAEDYLPQTVRLHPLDDWRITLQHGGVLQVQVVDKADVPLRAHVDLTLRSGNTRREVITVNVGNKNCIDAIIRRAAGQQIITHPCRYEDVHTVAVVEEGIKKHLCVTCGHQDAFVAQVACLATGLVCGRQADVAQEEGEEEFAEMWHLG